MTISESQKNLLNQIIDAYGIDSILEIVPHAYTGNIIQYDIIDNTDINLIIINIKKYVNCGSILSNLLQPYQSEIFNLFNKSINDVNINDLELLINKFPELNIEYIYKNFRSYYLDYPIECSTIYEYGYQTTKSCKNDELYYIKFYDLLMIDHDDKNGINIIEHFCKNHPTFLFKMYETYKGFHFVLTSHTIPNYHKSSIELMLALKCDPWYIIYSHRYGYKYRLNSKIRTDCEFEPFVAKYIKTIGSGTEHPKCMDMLKIYSEYLINPIKDKQYKDTNMFYDNFIKNTIYWKFNFNILETNANNFKNALRKPQQLICNNPDYYVAFDQKTRTFYICFKYLMMIDIDIQKLTVDTFDIIEHCETNFDKLQTAIQIYKSFHGYHLFIIDKNRLHSDLDSLKYMIDKGCDYNYGIFAYMRGYSVRLNKKHSDINNSDIYQYIGFYGNQSKIDQQLNHYVMIHYELMHKFQNDVQCLMK